MYQYWFEWLNWSGKSTVISLTSSLLKSNGVSVLESKISWLWNSQNIAKLIKVLDYRESERLSWRQTAKHLQDHLSQKLFRLATKIQLKEYLELKEKSWHQVSIFDRTPISTLVYVLSDEHRMGGNPYIREIKKETFELLSKVNLDKVFFLDIDPFQSIIRTIWRWVVWWQNIRKQITDACRKMDLPISIYEEVIKWVVDFREANPTLVPKARTSWDLNPYSVIMSEWSFYKEVLKEIKQTLWIDYEVFNSNGEETTVNELSLKIFNSIVWNIKPH